MQCNLNFTYQLYVFFFQILNTARYVRLCGYCDACRCSCNRWNLLYRVRSNLGVSIHVDAHENKHRITHSEAEEKQKHLWYEIL